MENRIKIREARSADFQDFCTMVAEVDALHAEGEPLFFKKTTTPGRKKEYFEKIISDPNTSIFMAEWNGQMAGFIHLECRVVPDLEILIQGKYGHVSDLVVLSGMQRRGVGTALMDQAENWARARGLSQLRLHVWSFNKGAIALYQKMGMTSKSQTMVKQIS